MLKDSHVNSDLWRLARHPQGLVRSAKGNVELWANLLVISWAMAFMLWKGVGFSITVGTVFAIWAILAVSLNLVVGFTGLLSVGHIGFFGRALVKTCGNSLPRPMADQSAAVAISYTWPRFRMPSSNPHPAKTRAIRFASPFNTRQFPLRRSTDLNTR